MLKPFILVITMILPVVQVLEDGAILTSNTTVTHEQFSTNKDCKERETEIVNNFHDAAAESATSMAGHGLITTCINRL